MFLFSSSVDGRGVETFLSASEDMVVRHSFLILFKVTTKIYRLLKIRNFGQ